MLKIFYRIFVDDLTKLTKKMRNAHFKFKKKVFIKIDRKSAKRDC